MTRNVLTAQQTARRLGVKLSTIYAYVSRGVIERSLARDGTSRFETQQVEELARRGRPRKEATRAGSVEVSLATAITGVEGDRLLFRGHEARKLATERTFEQVAELLWTETLPEGPVHWPKPSGAWLRALPFSKVSGPIERLCVATAVLASRSPLRVDLRRETVAEHARLLLTTFPEVLPALENRERQRGARPRGFAARLFARLSPLAPTSARVRVLDAALILLADHELATSTLAARVAASTRADPFAVVLAGLGAVSGPLHGRAAVLAQRMIAEAAESSAETSVARALGSSERIPGFGHPVYRGIDPRAACLLGELDALLKQSERGLVERLVQAGKRASSKEPNVDFALAAVAFALAMPLGSTEAIFAIARTAGFIAHALEEYEEAPLRFRARSIYLGKIP